MATRRQVDNVETRVKIEVDPKSEASVQKGQKILEKFSKSTKKTSLSIADISSTVTASILAFNAMASGLSTVANTIGNVAKKLQEIGMRGGEVSAIQQAFERIASPEVLRNLKDASGGLLTNIELQKEYTQVFRANLIDTEQDMARFYQAVIRASQDVGENTNQMIRTLGDALSKGEVEIFAKLGVNVVKLKDDLKEMGLSAESSAGRAELLKKILEDLERTTGGVNNETGNMNDAFTVTTSTFQDMYDEMSRNVSESKDMLIVFRSINEFLPTLQANSEGVATAIGAVVRGVAEGVVQISIIVIDVLLKIRDATVQIMQRWTEMARLFRMENFADALQEQVRAFDMYGRSIKTARENLLDFRQILADTAWAMEQEGPAALGGPIPQAGVGVGRRAGTGRGRGKGAGVQPGEVIDLLPAAPGGELEQLRIQIDLMEQFVAQNQELADIEAAIREAQQEDFERTAESKEHLNDLERKHIELLQRSKETASDYAREMMELERQRIESTHSYIDSIQTFGGAMVGILGQISQLEDQSTRKAEVLKKVKGGILSAISFVEAAQEIARSIGAFATGNIPGGVAHALSAAAHTAAGIMALTTLGGGGGGAPSQQSAPSTAATFTPREREEVEERPDKRTGTQIVIYTMGFHGARLGRELQNSQRELERAGLEPSMVGAGSFSQ